MSKKLKTMKVSGGDYAKVNSRMLEFRTENPRGLVETSHELIMQDGGDTYIVFKARVLKDKSDEHSAEATGSSMGKANGVKAFEKQETIAVGRALAFLGYGADGEIASSEEMEEFLQAKQERLAEQIFEVTEKVGACETLDDLKKEWAGLAGDLRNVEEIKTAFTNRKNQINEAN